MLSPKCIDIDLLPKFPPWESTALGALFAP